MFSFFPVTIEDLFGGLKNYLIYKGNHLTYLSLSHFYLNKTIALLKDGIFSLNIGMKEISLEDLYILNTFYPTIYSIAVVCDSVKQIRLCEGVTIKKITRFHSVE